MADLPIRGVVLDTTAAIRVSRGDETVLRELRKYARWLLPFAAWGELWAGVELAPDRKGAVAALRELRRSSELFLPTGQTARIYGQIHATLIAKGRPIPHNDEWIAATALQLYLPVATRDEHFEFVPGLKVIHI